MDYDLIELQKQYPKKDVGTRTENIEGKIFNDWKALYRTENVNKKVTWVCQCQLCGKIKPVRKGDLTSGTSKNCGCLRELTKINKRSNEVREYDDNGVLIKKKCFRCQQWLSIDNFWKNSTQKDGYSGECKQCSYTSKENRYNIYKKNAKKRELIFELSKEDFYNLTSMPCEYCGDLEDYNGIDRINSSYGYTVENCVPCCAMCNKMKLDYNISDWIKHIKKIANYYNKEEL